MSSTPAPLARVLARLVELGGDVHVHADGSVRSTVSPDLPVVDTLSPGEVAAVWAVVPSGDSRLSLDGDCFRMVRGEDFVVVRLLSLPRPVQPPSPEVRKPSFASLLGVRDGALPADFPPELVAMVADSLESSTRAAISRGDYAVVAELDQMSALLRDAAANRDA